jgi:hypothetical protein
MELVIKKSPPLQASATSNLCFSTRRRAQFKRSGGSVRVSSSRGREKLVSIPIHPLPFVRLRASESVLSEILTPLLGVLKGRRRVRCLERHWAKFRPLDNTIAFIKIATSFIWAQGGTINKSLSARDFLPQSAMHFFCETKHTRDIAAEIMYYISCTLATIVRP